MEPKPKERIVFDEDLYYGDEGEEMAINDLMERDGLTEDEVREDFTDDEIFNHQMEMKDFDYEEEMRALAAFFNGEKSDMSDFVNPYGGNHILVSGSVGRWNGTSTGIAVYKDFDAATDCSPSRFGQGNVFADCEIQKVWDENGTLYLAGAHHDGRVSVEMRQLTDEGERLWGQLDYEDYLPLEGLTAMGKHYELGDENRFVHDLYNSPELCAAPRYVEQSFGCPSEEYEKEEGTLPHDFTTGKWRVHLIYPGERYGLDGCLTYELNAYSGVPAAAHRASYPLVEFYDTSQDAARFPGGQFVSRYYMTDLLEDDSIAVSLDTMLKNGNQFSLDGGIPAWTVEGDDLAKVNDFLKKSCMEFCGSLPGDEKDEDGYSLTGEAKDATALGITERNPSRMVGNVRGQKPLVDFWTLDEFEKVISKLYKGDYYEHYLFISLLFLFMSGMRLGEASALLWSDIDFTTGLCSITKTLYYHNQSDYKFTKPKTRAAIRSIYLDEDTLSELAAWRKVQRVVIPDCEFVLSYNGLPTTKTRLPRAMKKLADLAGVHRVRVHDLRHSHASLLINMGESPLLLKERLGHEKIQTTLGTYGHLYPNTNQAVAKKLTGILNYSEPKTSIANYTSNQHTADYHRA